MLGAGGPAVTAIQQGRVAMKLALNVIDKIPIVNPDVKGIKLDPSQLKG